MLKRIPECALLAMASVFMAGCHPPTVSTFQAYETSVVSLRESAENALQVEGKESKDKFIRRVTEDPKPGTIVEDQLRLLLPPEPATPFAYKMPAKPVTFLEAAGAERALQSLNDAMVKHAHLLTALASMDVASNDVIDKAASDINGDITDVIDAINGVKSSGGPGAETIKLPPSDQALISTGVAELMRQFLLKKQSELLVKVIDESIPAVKGYAESVQTLVRFCSYQRANTVCESIWRHVRRSQQQRC